jgi:thiamine pyrophosphokinase
MDSIRQETLDYFEKLSRIQRTPDQESTDLSKALDLIGETEAVNYGEVSILWII